MKNGVLFQLAMQFGLLSMLAFGGANAVLPEMHRQSVAVHHWMSDKEFAALFAIAQAAPGPNFMVATLVGWKAAGIADAIATAAMCGPSCLLTFFVMRAWDRYQGHPWRTAVAAGMSPVTVGLIFSTAFVLLKATVFDWRLGAAAAISGLVAYFTKPNPLWCLGLAAALGALGLLGAG